MNMNTNSHWEFPLCHKWLCHKSKKKKRTKNRQIICAHHRPTTSKSRKTHHQTPTRGRGGALTSLPPQLIQHSFTFCAVPENMAAPLTNVLGPRRMRAPPLLHQLTVNTREDFPRHHGSRDSSHSRHRPPFMVHQHNCIFQETREGATPLF